MTHTEAHTLLATLPPGWRVRADPFGGFTVMLNPDTRLPERCDHVVSEPNYHVPMTAHCDHTYMPGPIMGHSLHVGRAAAAEGWRAA